MTLGLLYADEMRGFYKSYVMLALWVGLPALTIALHFLQPLIEPAMRDWSLSYVVSITIAGIGGPLASVSLSASIVSERNQKVYELFLIRPVRRSSLILAKFAATYTCLVVATVISLASGMVIDSWLGVPFESLWNEIVTSVVVTLSAMAMACSGAVLIGMFVSSVALASIVSIFGGEILILVPMLPNYFDPSANPVPLAIVSGLVITSLFLVLTIHVFNHRQI